MGELVILMSLLTLALSVATASLLRGLWGLVLRVNQKRRIARRTREMRQAFMGMAASQPSHKA